MARRASVETRRRLEEAKTAAEEELARRLVAEHPGMFFVGDQISGVVRSIRNVLCQHVPDPTMSRLVIEDVRREIVSQDLFNDQRSQSAEEERLIRSAGVDPDLVVTGSTMWVFAGEVIRAVTAHVPEPAVLPALRRGLDAVLLAYGINLKGEEE